MVYSRRRAESRTLRTLTRTLSSIGIRPGSGFERVNGESLMRALQVCRMDFYGRHISRRLHPRGSWKGWSLTVCFAQPASWWSRSMTTAGGTNLSYRIRSRSPQCLLCRRLSSVPTYIDIVAIIWLQSAGMVPHVIGGLDPEPIVATNYTHGMRHFKQTGCQIRFSHGDAKRTNQCVAPLRTTSGAC